MKSSLIIFFVLVCSSIFAQSSFFINWQKSFGGSASDFGDRIVSTSNGEFYQISSIMSNDGDITGNHGLHDIWLKKIDSNGLIIWQIVIGGSSEEYGVGLQATNDGGCVFTGATYSNDGDFNGNNGYSDVLVVKVSGSGTIQWRRRASWLNYSNPATLKDTSRRLPAQGWSDGTHSWQ